MIDPQYKRLVALNGQMIERVEFGYDLLGYINKGGAFAIHRQRVSPTHWKTDLIDIHVSGRVLLFRTVDKEQYEVRSGFRAVSESMTLEQVSDVKHSFPRLGIMIVAVTLWESPALGLFHEVSFSIAHLPTNSAIEPTIEAWIHLSLLAERFVPA